jgi:hypothetical protein
VDYVAAVLTELAGFGLRLAGGDGSGRRDRDVLSAALAGPVRLVVNAAGYARQHLPGNGLTSSPVNLILFWLTQMSVLHLAILGR